MALPLDRALMQRETQRQAPFLPAPAPLVMPIQDLFSAHADWPVPASAPHGIVWRRALVFGLAFAMTAYGAYAMFEVLNVGGLTFVESAILVLFTLLNAWLALSLASAAGGAISLLSSAHSGLDIPDTTPLPALHARCAVLMPTYNEEPARVFGGLAATYRSLEGTGRLEAFDFFILSDTTDGETWLREEATFLALRQRLGATGRLFYRRRSKNTDRKAGNIADWVTRFGGAYESMVVLDADSVMRGDTIVRLAGAMENASGCALIQTLPAIVQGKTLYARAQSFAGRLYGPLIARGIAWWHGSEGNFWGHNAIIRVRAFAEAAGLPHLPGKKPFGGHILSHDFVEAALLRRAGWAVHMAPHLEGSFEEGPPTIGDGAVRDRRWAQGNLQHSKILGARGLSFISRMHLFLGIASYVTSPLLMMLIGLGLALAVQAQLLVPNYFPEGFSLFPRWPAQDPVLAAAVFMGTMGILLVPKFIALALTFFSTARAKRFGGRARLLLSFFTEMLLSALIAPIAMADQSMAVVSILAGKDSGWNPQQRDESAVPWEDLARAYWKYSLAGLLLAVVSLLITPTLALWMAPIWIGLVFSIPLARLVSRRAGGRMLAGPEDIDLPEELALAVQERLALSTVLPARTRGLELLLHNPDLLDAHVAALENGGLRAPGDYTPERLSALAKLDDARSLQEALTLLTPREFAAALGDKAALTRLTQLAPQVSL